MILASSLLLAVAGAVATAEPIAIRVDDVALTRADVRARAAELRSRGFPATPAAVAQNLIDEALLARAARGGKLVPARAAQIASANDRQRFLADAYVERVLSKSVPVTEEQLRKTYHQSDAVRMKLLLFTTREDAQASRDRLAVSGAWPVENAYSIVKAKYRDGDTGLRMRIELDPKLAEFAFKAPLKTLTGPVELDLGWAVFSVIERDLGDEASYAQRRPALQAIARSENLTVIRQHYAEVTRKQARVTLDDRFLEGLGKRTAVTEAEANHVVATLDGGAITFAEIAPNLRGLGGGGGHMAGPGVKKQIIENYIEERLLAKAAVAASLEQAPDVAHALSRSEARALANLAADAIRAGGASGGGASRERAVASFVDGLRKQARIQVDGDAVSAALAN